MVTIKSDREIELMKEACKVVALTYKKLEEVIKPGMSTWELDQIAEKTMRDLGALPAEKGYDPGIRGVPPYPAALCVSINDEVIHGVPSKNKIIKNGEYLNTEYKYINEINIPNYDLANGSKDTYIIEWKWIDNDSADTLAGQNADLVKYSLKISISGSQK